MSWATSLPFITELEQIGTRHEIPITPPVLPEFYLADSALHSVYVYRAEFRDPFNSLMVGNIITNPVEIEHSNVGKIRALL